jgi:hypothetical protein
MQPLDRCPNGELKKLFAKEFRDIPSQTASESRLTILQRAMSCLDTALSTYYSKKGWKESGLHPFDSEKIIGRSDVVQPLPENAPEQQRKRTRGEKFNNRILTAGQFPILEPLRVVEV